MGESEKMYIPSKEYEQIVRADNGRPLTDLFPNGILVTMKGDGVTDIQDGSGISRGCKLLNVPLSDAVLEEVNRKHEIKFQGMKILY